MLRRAGKPKPTGWTFYFSVLCLFCALLGNLFLDLAQIEHVLGMPSLEDCLFRIAYYVAAIAEIILIPFWFIALLIAGANTQRGFALKEKTLHESGLLALWNLGFAALVTVLTAFSCFINSGIR